MFQRIIPNPPPAYDFFATHQLTYEFRQEVQYRENFKSYCEWYRNTAAKHQQEVAKMDRDINIFGWFLRG